MAIRTISMLKWLVVGMFFLPLIVLSQRATYSFEEADSLRQVEQRPVLIFIHTEWCRFCREMEQSTLKDGRVAELLNDYFWFVDLDAEEKRTIRFGGHIFEYKPRGYETGVNELAEQLGTIDGKLSFPSVCVVNSENEIVFQAGGFLSAKDLTKMLRVLIEKD